MCAPEYQDVPSSKIPEVQSANYSVRVIAGTAMGVDAVINTKVPTQYLDIRMEKNAELEHSYPVQFNAFAYVYEGAVQFGESKVSRGEIAIFSLLRGEQTTTATIRATTTSSSSGKFLFIAGQPLNEPVARRGPFVMNTQEEIQQAFRDYQSGNFGKKKGKMTSTIVHDKPYEPDR
jgi:redox-sensitive bicupin YhaK (pirin superfamily)